MDHRRPREVAFLAVLLVVMAVGAAVILAFVRPGRSVAAVDLDLRSSTAP